MASYAQVYAKIIGKFSETVGEVAITQARAVNQVELDENKKPKGEIQKEDIQKLLEQYEKIMKDGAKGIAREAVRDAYNEDQSVKDLDLPDEIVPKEVKADQFASAL